MARIVKIGIAPYAVVKARTIAIARGEYKPRAGEPKVWLTSLKSVASALSDENQFLLRLIRAKRPASIQALAALTGRAPGNLSRTLRTLERCGIVALRPERERGTRSGRAAIRPEVLGDRFEFQLELAA